MLIISPITFRAACAFVAQHHRHNKPPKGHKFSIAVRRDGVELVGVVMCGRPIARPLDNGLTIEVNRTCTDGTRNANSMLYGAAWRAARAMGYERAITYTRQDESGDSLRGAGWVRVKDLTAWKNWRASSKDARHVRMRDATADLLGALPDDGGVARVLWEIRAGAPLVSAIEVAEVRAA